MGNAGATSWTGIVAGATDNGGSVDLRASNGSVAYRIPEKSRSSGARSDLNRSSLTDQPHLLDRNESLDGRLRHRGFDRSGVQASVGRTYDFPFRHCDGALAPLLREVRSEFTQALRSGIADRFARVSLTVPLGRDGRDAVLAMSRQYAQTLAALATSSWLALDVRNAERGWHLFGFALTPCSNNELKRAWSEISGARPHAMNVVSVSGWTAFQRGEEDEFALNLHRTLDYALKVWPGALERDLDRDVVSAGALKRAWDVARRRVGAPKSSAPRDGSCVSTEPSPCPQCSKPVLRSRRDARFCSDPCRKKNHRNKKRAGTQGKGAP